MIIPNIWENKKCSKPPTRSNSSLSFGFPDSHPIDSIVVASVFRHFQNAQRIWGCLWQPQKWPKTQQCHHGANDSPHHHLHEFLESNVWISGWLEFGLMTTHSFFWHGQYSPIHVGVVSDSYASPIAGGVRPDTSDICTRGLADQKHGSLPSHQKLARTFGHASFIILSFKGKSSDFMRLHLKICPMTTSRILGLEVSWVIGPQPSSVHWYFSPLQTIQLLRDPPNRPDFGWPHPPISPTSPTGCLVGELFRVAIFELGFLEHHLQLLSARAKAEVGGEHHPVIVSNLMVISWD